MYGEADRARDARIEQLLTNLKVDLELISGPDGTVWYCLGRVLRYAIPAEANLATYQAHLRNKGYSDAVVSKNASQLKSFGSPLYETGGALAPHALDAIVAGVDGAISDEAILAAIAAIPSGGAPGTPVPAGLSDADLERIAKAVTDEQARRLAS